MGTDEGRFDCVGLEGQMRSIHADQHKLTTRRRKPDIMERYKLAHGVRRQFRSYGQQLFDPRSWKKSRSPTPSLVGRLSAASTHAARLEGRTNKHWPAKASKLCCRISSASGQCQGTVFKCAEFEVGLCMVPFFLRVSHQNKFVKYILNSE